VAESEAEMSTEVMVDAQLNIRWAIRKDMEAVMQIENDCFPIPWSDADFHRALCRREIIGLVAEIEECVVGFVIYEFRADRLIVLNFAVRPDCQRRGIGTALVNKLKSKLRPERRKRITLHARESNIIAQKFFSSQGFRALGVKRDLYQCTETNEDAYLFQYRLPICSGR